MDRFFVSKDAIREDMACITGEDVAHITKVLRLQPGDRICLCDGAGKEYTACIKTTDKQAVTLRLEEARACKTEPPYAATLYQALPKAGKMEWIIQKCVELGVVAVQPVMAARCVANPADFEKKRIRYQRVANEAAKQCRRGILPQVQGIRPLLDCDFSGHGLVVLAYEEETDKRLHHVLAGARARDIALIIGPEGGLTKEEAAALQARGAHSVSLGKRILRTETAGMAMLAMLLYAWEG